MTGNKVTRDGATCTLDSPNLLLYHTKNYNFAKISTLAKIFTFAENLLLKIKSAFAKKIYCSITSDDKEIFSFLP
jgi:hypothetical protein